MSAVNITDKLNRDQRVKDLEEERKYDRESTDDALIARLVAQVNKHSASLSLPTMGFKMYAKNGSDHLKAIEKITDGKTSGFTDEQLKQLNDINAINKVTNDLNLESNPYGKYLGEIAGALGAIQQFATVKTKAKEQDQIQDNLTKSIYHMQNGGKFGDIAPALGVGTLRSGMNAAATISAGSWLYDMATTGKLSSLTDNSLAKFEVIY